MEREKKYNYVRKTFSWDGKRYDVKGKTIEEVYKKIAKMKVSLERGRKSSCSTASAARRAAASSIL